MDMLIFHMKSDVYKIQEGIGDKAGMLIQAYTTLIASFIIGFLQGWKLTLVLLAVSPLLAISAALYSKVNVSVVFASLLKFAFSLSQPPAGIIIMS